MKKLVFLLILLIILTLGFSLGCSCRKQPQSAMNINQAVNQVPEALPNVNSYIPPPEDFDTGEVDLKSTNDASQQLIESYEASGNDAPLPPIDAMQLMLEPPQQVNPQ